MKSMDLIKSYKKELEGIEFLRDAIYWLDGSKECENQGKNPIQLLQDYAKAIKRRNP